MTQSVMQLGEILLVQSEQKLETVARNVSNTSTPGFKRELHASTAADRGRQLSSLRGDEPIDANGATPRSASDFSQGALRLTSRQLDLAIDGSGFFQVRKDDNIFYSRGGQFDRAASGQLVTPDGYALQTTSGSDLVVGSSDIEILADGVVLEGGVPIAQIALAGPSGSETFASIGGGLYYAPGEITPAETSLVRQGMLEASNVEMAEEMVTMMTALREAESGARLVQLYNSLVGQSITAFGQSR